MFRWKSVVAGWDGGMSVSGWESGCLSFSFCRFSGLSATRVVEGEEANLTAPGKSPSSSLEDTLAANNISEGPLCVVQVLARCIRLPVHGVVDKIMIAIAEIDSASTSLGHARHRLGKRRRCQAASLLW